MQLKALIEKIYRPGLRTTDVSIASNRAERIILERLWGTTQILQILLDQNFGFREAHIAEHQILIIEHAVDTLYGSSLSRC